MKTALDIKLAHQNMVRKLAKNPTEILASLDPKKSHLLHMFVGIMDEVYELSIAQTNNHKKNIVEELGDMLFYTEGLIQDFDINIAGHKFFPLSRDETYQILARTVKRHVFYEQELDMKNLVNCYLNLIAWIKFDATALGLTIVDVQNNNMEKLAERYPNYDYTDKKANERVDKTYKVVCTNTIDSEFKELVEPGLTHEKALELAKEKNNKESEQSPYYFEVVEEN